MKLEELYRIFLNSTGVSTDTRNISEGNLFFALSGEKFNGNIFAEEALNKGCSFAIVDDVSFVKSDRYILVDNCLKTLQDLAKFHRNKFTIPFIGITGSNGKTTTKELIAAVLEQKFKVIKTEGNLNNHIGVPLTLFRVNKETEIAIIEMGANHQNEIEFLANIAQPTHGIITNIGKAHLEGFGGFEGVKKTKNELYQNVIENKGIIFANSDNPILTSLLDNKDVKTIFYGSKPQSVTSGEIIQSDPYLEIELIDRQRIKTKLAGRYNFENVLASVCIGTFFQVPANLIKEALENYQPSNQRSQMKQTEKNLLLMDYYNANPSSMEAALMNFQKMDHPKKAVILGDMLELGEEGISEHNKIVEQVLSMNVELVVLVGSIFYHLPHRSGLNYFENSLDAKHWLKSENHAGYLILVKGSRGIKLENIIDSL